MSRRLPPSFAPLCVDAARATLLVIDIQTKLTAVMPDAERAMCQRNWIILIELARRLRLPVVWSEQYPQGLGPTVPAVAEALASPGLMVQRLEKITFACTDCDDFAPLERQLAPPLGRGQWIVMGMETHVCVWQTVRGLLATGAEVHLPADATISRAPANHQIGLALCQRAGAVITSTETVAFDALERAGTEDFKAISRLVR
jgi:nicotinamidase-related amidase